MSITIDDEVAIPCISVMVFLLLICAFNKQLFLHCYMMLWVCNFFASVVIFLSLHLDLNDDGFHWDSAFYLISAIFAHCLFVTVRFATEEALACETPTKTETVNEESTDKNHGDDEDTSSVTATTSDEQSSSSSVDDDETDDENIPATNNKQITCIDLKKCKHFTINVTGIIKNEQNNNANDDETPTIIPTSPQQLENENPPSTTPNFIRKSIYDNKLSAIKDSLFAKLFETDDDDAIDNYTILCDLANHDADKAYERLKITIRNSIEDMLKPADDDDEHYDGIAELADNIVSIMETDNENSTQSSETRSEHSNENICIHDGIVKHAIEQK